MFAAIKGLIWFKVLGLRFNKMLKVLRLLRFLECASCGKSSLSLGRTLEPSTPWTLFYCQLQTANYKSYIICALHLHYTLLIALRIVLQYPLPASASPIGATHHLSPDGGTKTLLPLTAYLYSRRYMNCASHLHYALRITHYALSTQYLQGLATNP